MNYWQLFLAVFKAKLHGERVRIDRDIPKNDDLYVIRIERSDGCRYKATISTREAERLNQAGSPLPDYAAGKARILVSQINEPELWRSV